MVSWRVDLLGKAVAVPETGEAVEKWRSRKTPLILAYLLHKPARASTRDELGVMFWPESEGSAQKTRLRWEINQVRSLLGKDALETPDYSLVRLGSGIISDVTEFDRLALAVIHAGSVEQRLGPLKEALALYGDDYLPGYLLPEETLPENDWLTRERERLQGVAYDLYGRLALDLETLGLHDDSNAVRREAAARFPDRETLVPSDLPLPPPPIPLPRNRFYGRTEESQRIAEWRAGTGCLLTLTGIGGMGKTRLSLEATRGDRLAFVALADLGSADDFFATIHAALELPDDTELSVEQQVTAALRARGGCLLVLDNLEQIAEDAAPLVHRLLDSCPLLRCLVTSRLPLGIPGEVELPLEPLGAEDAYGLFLDRARVVRPDFAHTAEAQADAVKVVALLDGVPLAIEIAAGHALVLGPRQMLEQLRKRPEFLQKLPGAGGDEPRHRSIRAALAWSLNLLPPKVREVFFSTSAFRGGFSLGAAAAVCAPSGDIVRHLERLERHSLLKVSFDVNEEARYAYLPLTQELAEEQRMAASDAATEAQLRGRHAEFFRAEALRVGVELNAGRWSELRRLLLRDRENFRAAGRYFLAQGTGDAVFDLMRSLAAPLCELGWWGDAQELLSGADPGPDGDPVARGRLLAVRGALYLRRGDVSDARTDWLTALELCRVVGNPLATVTALFDLAGLALDSGDPESAALWIAEGEALADTHRTIVDGMPGKTVAAAVLRSRLALVSPPVNPDRAVAAADEAVAGLRTLGTDPRNVSVALTAYVAIHVPPAYRVVSRPEAALEILSQGLNVALAEEQTFLVARLLDEFAPTLFALSRERDSLACAYVAAAIHAELRTRHRRRAIAAREDTLERVYTHPDPDQRQSLLSLLKLLEARPWKDSLEALAGRLLTD